VRRALIRLAVAAVVFSLAASAGYLLSSSLGQDALRGEAERRLADVMRGEVEIERLRVVLHLGLELEAEGVRVYPGPSGPGLEARRVDAEIDLLSLLLGGFRLRWLRVHDLHMRIARSADGRWSPHPVAALADGSDERPPDDPERHLGPLRACEAVTRALVESGRVASLVELRGGRVSFVDWLPGGPRRPPVTLEVESAFGTWDHRWLSRDPELSLRAVFVDGNGHRARFEAEGRRLEGDRLRLALAATRLPVDALEPYLARGADRALGGRLSGVLAFETPEPGSGQLELDWIVDEPRLAFPRRDDRLRIEAPRSALTGRIVMHPGMLRLASGRIAGEQAELLLDGRVERPLRESSRARLRARVRGADLGVVRHAVERLPPSDAEPLTRLLERVEDGRITEVRATGATRLHRWRELFAGELPTLPRGFLLSAEVADLAIRTGTDDPVQDLAGLVEWSGDRIDLRDVTGRWRGQPLPTLDLALEGVSRLAQSAASAGEPRPGAEPLPGLDPLLRLLRGGDGAEEASPPLPPVHLEIDRVDHPALRWPVVRARVTVEALEDGLQIAIPGALWAGAPVRGEAVWLREPENRLSASLRVDDGGATPTDDSAAPGPGDGAAGGGDGAAADGTAAVWARGRFRVEPLERGPLAFARLEGSFRAQGADVELGDLRAELAPQGVAEGRVRLGLSDGEAVGLSADFQLADGDLARLCLLIGFEEGFATGSVRLAGELSGTLRPETPPFAGLSGGARLEAREGLIQKRVPLVVAMAQATEGFNTFARRDSITYEKIESVFELESGRLSTEELTLEGPVRVFASGWLDLSSRPEPIDAVVGVFLFRQADRMFGNIPLVNLLVSDKGLMGAYFGIEGTLQEPSVRSMPVKSITESVPDVVKAPFKVLRFLFGGAVDDEQDEDAPRFRPLGPAGAKGLR